uniref:Uncharacterized protein n=1 Tax=Romanomermis culicivorax TaxID=13658 RepID=A0A915KZR3_ROMCU
MCDQSEKGACSPSMTQRRGIALRILVFPPGDGGHGFIDATSPSYCEHTSAQILYDKSGHYKSADNISFHNNDQFMGDNDISLQSIKNRNFLTVPSPDVSPVAKVQMPGDVFDDSSRMASRRESYMSTSSGMSLLSPMSMASTPDVSTPTFWRQHSNSFSYGMLKIIQSRLKAIAFF